MTMPLVKIGEIFGGRDHTTILHHIHQYGSNAYTPKELIVNATGEQLNEKYFLEYLRRKYLI